MATPSFRLFPDLPTELRLQIWGAACHEREEIHPGMQYTKVQHSSPKHVHLVHQPIHLNEKERFRAMRYGGLWLACKESQDIIQERYNDLPHNERTLPSSDGWPHYVNPGHDIFYIQNPEEINHERKTYTVHDISISASPRINDFHHLKNIALEFDPSWNEGFLGQYSLIRDEDSARGFLYRLVRSQYCNNNWQTTVWLIDNDMKWTRRPRSRGSGASSAPKPGPSKMFINGNESYVEASPSGTCQFGPDKENPAIKYFFWNLNNNGNQCRSQYSKPVADDDIIDGHWEFFNIAQKVRVLARASNEVEFCKKDHHDNTPRLMRFVKGTTSL